MNSYKQPLNISQHMHVVQVINVMYSNLLNNVHVYGMMEDNYVKQLVLPKIRVKMKYEHFLISLQMYFQLLTVDQMSSSDR